MREISAPSTTGKTTLIIFSSVRLRLRWLPAGNWIRASVFRSKRLLMFWEETKPRDVYMIPLSWLSTRAGILSSGAGAVPFNTALAAEQLMLSPSSLEENFQVVSSGFLVSTINTSSSDFIVHPESLEIFLLLSKPRWTSFTSTPRSSWLMVMTSFFTSAWILHSFSVKTEGAQLENNPIQIIVRPKIDQ